MAIKNNITAVIISGNEQNKIASTVKALLWCKKTILVAANSTDNTKINAITANPNIEIRETFDQYGKNFSKWRNIGLKHTKTDWLLYIDADEIVSNTLKEEIENITSSNSVYTHFAIPRANHFLGQRVKHGGTYPDYVIRLFQTKSLTKWSGKLHEQPIVKGQLSYLHSNLLHYTHTDLNSMLNKTIIWTQVEASALYQSNHPPIVWWRFIRMFFTKLFERLIFQKMFLDGQVGWISSLFESYNTFIIYARLWENQQNEKSRHL